MLYPKAERFGVEAKCLPLVVRQNAGQVGSYFSVPSSVEREVSSPTETGEPAGKDVPLVDAANLPAGAGSGAGYGEALDVDDLRHRHHAAVRRTRSPSSSTVVLE